MVGKKLSAADLAVAGDMNQVRCKVPKLKFDIDGLLQYWGMAPVAIQIP